jgi:predicted transcriptional regulator of viral defense system
MNKLEQFGIIPVDFATLASIFSDYRFPKDKIAGLEKSGDLIRLKKGTYIVSPKIHNQHISKELIANHLYGPSYVSFESALSFYGLIPERVYNIHSMTIKRARTFPTPIGTFEYTTAEKRYFEIGIHQKIIEARYAWLIASPEKALCDIIVATPLLRIQSVKALQTFLEEDLRVDLSMIKNFDAEIVRRCMACGKKKTAFTQLYKFFRQ